MSNKVAVLVVGKKVSESSAYEIAGTVSSEIGKNQFEVEVKSISSKEMQVILEALDEAVQVSPERGKVIDGLIKKLTPQPVEDDE